MSSSYSTSQGQKITNLMGAFANNVVEDALHRLVTPGQWETIGGYMQPFSLAQGQLLITEGSLERTLYFVETGSLSVHFEDRGGKVHLAILGPGSAVGEGSFFSQAPRSATVQAVSACELWALNPIRFAELSNRQPAVALALSMALGALISRRMVNQRRRAAIT
jgi:CRP-like cAMP-binding protein